MKTKIIYFLIALSVAVAQTCSEKAILKGSSFIYNEYSDYDGVYHGIASCYSLETGDDSLCCYIKVKFKNKEADKKFTHKGCYTLTSDDYLNDIDKTIENLETNLNDDDNIEKVDIKLDCNSKFMRLAGLILLSLLLF